MAIGGRKGVVLVVEDEWLIRAEIVDELKRCGWAVLEASTGEGALAILQADGPVDVMITDIQLGGYLTGWDVAEASRATRPKIAVIYVSGNAANPKRAVNDSLFMDKPYQVSRVVEACRTLLSA